MPPLYTIPGPRSSSCTSVTLSSTWVQWLHMCHSPSFHLFLWLVYPSLQLTSLEFLVLFYTKKLKFKIRFYLCYSNNFSRKSWKIYRVESHLSPWLYFEQKREILTPVVWDLCDSLVSELFRSTHKSYCFYAFLCLTQTLSKEDLESYLKKYNPEIELTMYRTTRHIFPITCN